MASTNPVSPKVFAAGIGSIVGPLLLAVGGLIVDILSSGSLNLPSPWDQVAFVAASVIGALVASYSKTDPLRIPTVDQEAVAQLDAAKEEG